MELLLNSGKLINIFVTYYIKTQYQIKMKHLNQNKMGKEEFFKAYGHRLVNVMGDDTETGSFQLFSPEESHLAFQYQQNGFDIASVFEKEDSEDYIVLDNDSSSSHHKIGYLILTPKQR